jgi:hypothetical protein
MFEAAHPLAADRPECCDVLAGQGVVHATELDHANVAQPEKRRFELPVAIWVGMLASYAVFFASMISVAGGSGHAAFAVVISIGYTIVFFGVSRLIARQAGPDAPSPLLRGKDMPTWCGPMESKAVYGQILIVPMAVAAFGIGIAIMVAVIL